MVEKFEVGKKYTSRSSDSVYTCIEVIYKLTNDGLCQHARFSWGPKEEERNKYLSLYDAAAFTELKEEQPTKFKVGDVVTGTHKTQWMHGKTGTIYKVINRSQPTIYNINTGGMDHTTSWYEDELTLASVEPTLTLADISKAVSAADIYHLNSYYGVESDSNNYNDFEDRTAEEKPMELKDIKPANLKEAAKQVAQERASAEITFAKQQLKYAQDFIDALDREIKQREESKKVHLEVLAKFK